MHYIGRAMDKHQDQNLVFIIDPDVVYTREAARKLAEASITLNAIMQPKTETVVVDRATTAWEYVRNTLIAVMLLTVAVVSVGWSFNIGWIMGNEHHQETHIDQAPTVTGPIAPFNRERGK